ncbi:MAG TPA: DUF2891 domain-containing protein [Caulobacteraceae bacterium]|nr:DUF2891 domain-containing protein [Caulobacteraceae bacterium]
MSLFTQDHARSFAAIAMGHIGREYPNKLDHVLTGPQDLEGPRALHPIFYGSFDWHSAVHSHWLLARCHRRFPDPAIAARLDEAFTEANVAGELAYLARPSARGFERPYGWGWLLALQAELEAATSPEGRRWAAAMKPLARAFAERFRTWLPKALYPVRTGVHSNTAFACALALEYADRCGDAVLGAQLRRDLLGWYAGDADCQAWEPSGSDFLSPALVEAECMRRALEAGAFEAWFARFLPRLGRREPATLFTPAEVSDRSDGQIAHLDGLNLSRAWCFRSLADAAGPEARPVLLEAADEHLAAAMPHLSGDYMGEHWLATFALLALDGDGV